MPGISASKIGIPFSKKGMNWNSYWKQQKNNVAFVSNGEFITDGDNVYLKDISGNNYHMLITNKDFSTAYIPSNTSTTFSVNSASVVDIGNDGFWVIDGVAQQKTYTEIREKITVICDRSLQDRIGFIVIPKATNSLNTDYAYRYCKNTVLNSLYTSLNRTGSALRQTDLAAVSTNTFNFNSLPVVDLPEYTEINYILIGVDQNGFLVKSGSDYFTTEDGVVFTPRSLNIVPDLVVVSVNGYKYARLGVSDGRVYRTTTNAADNYTFALCFTFATNGILEYNNFSSYGDDVLISSYAGASNTGTEIYFSLNNGDTWAKYDVGYGQRHLHNSIIHPSGRWFVTVGEAISTQTYRGVIYSDDKGQSWTQTYYRNNTYANEKQPWAAVVDGDNIIYGADNDPTNFIILNALTLVFSEINSFNSGGNTLTNNGFVPTLLSVGGKFIGYKLGRSDEIHLGRYLFTKSTVVALEQPLSKNKVYDGHGFDFNGKIATLTLDNTKTLICDAWSYSNDNYVLNSSLLPSIISFDSSAIVGETYQGIPVCKTKKNEMYSDNPRTSCVPGDVIKINYAVKRYSGHSEVNNNINVALRCYNAGGTSLGYVSLNGSLASGTNDTGINSLPFDSYYHYVDLYPVTIPETVGGGVPASFSVLINHQYGSLIAVDPNNFHYILSKMTCYKNAGSNNTLYKYSAYKDIYFFKKYINSSFVFKDTILHSAFGQLLTADTNIPLLRITNGVNIIEMGLLKATGSATNVTGLYLDYNGVQQLLLGGAAFGGSLSETISTCKNLASGTAYNNNVIPSPIVFELQKTKVRLRSPESGEYSEYSLTNEISGEILGELLYEAMHKIEYTE